MPKGVYDHSNQRKPFCSHRHDISIVGRNMRGKCNECANPVASGLRLPKSRKKQFCPRNHDKDIVGRTNAGGCAECARLRNRDYKEKNKEKVLAKHLEWLANHPEQVKALSKKSREKNKKQIAIRKKICYERNKDKILARCKEYYEKHKDEIIARNNTWKATHPEIMRASRLKCTTNRLLRIVAWTDWDNILEFERNKPKGMTTDHYIPLQNPLVWGLHVSWNLQYLTKSQNSKKWNKIDLIEVSEWYGNILKEAGLK